MVLLIVLLYRLRPHFKGKESKDKPMMLTLLSQHTLVQHFISISPLLCFPTSLQK